ncbi:MAG: cytochrome b/b6 domain-containing protein [Planctomycetota bacterium]|nr:cytochrome b/b6 domain-containing protein [Planctomycetota bacterium]
MSLFQIVSIAGIVGTLAFLPLHYLLFARRQPHPGLGQRTVRRYSLWERLVHLALTVSFLVLAVTGFAASIGWGGPMKGYVLMLHTTCGAVFAVSVGAMLLTWAADHAFNSHDGQFLARGGCLTYRKDLPAARFTGSDKIYFWMAGVLALVALLTMLLSMIPLLGTPGQSLMYETHRYSTLVLVMITIWHAYATTLAKPGTLGSLISGYVSAAWAKRYHPLWGKPTGLGPVRHV